MSECPGIVIVDGCGPSTEHCRGCTRNVLCPGCSHGGDRLTPEERAILEDARELWLRIKVPAVVSGTLDAFEKIIDRLAPRPTQGD